MRTYKLAVLMSHPIQYHVPIFRALAARSEVDLTVYFCCDRGLTERKDPEFGISFKWDIPLLEGYHSVFLRNYSPNPGPTTWGQLNPGIVRQLARHEYDALLVHGWNSAATGLGFLSALATRTPLLLRGVTHLLDERPAQVRLLKRLLLGPLFRASSACLYLGTHNRRYYEHYGVNGSKLVHVPHVVDNDFFQTQAEAYRGRKTEIRRAWSIDNEEPIILFAGKLVPKKQPDALLSAYQKLRAQIPCNLLYVGDGLLRNEIESQVAQRHIPNVYLTGFLNQTEMPRAYAAVDVIVLPSRQDETWGLVVNEAMNFGLPVIVSDRVGCGPDLVRQDENGYIVDSPTSLEEALYLLTTDAGKRTRFGKKSREIISSWGIPECVSGIVAALERVADK